MIIKYVVNNQLKYKCIVFPVFHRDVICCIHLVNLVKCAGWMMVCQVGWANTLICFIILPCFRWWEMERRVDIQRGTSNYEKTRTIVRAIAARTARPTRQGTRKIGRSCPKNKNCYNLVRWYPRIVEEPTWKDFVIYCHLLVSWGGQS